MDRLYARQLKHIQGSLESVSRDPLGRCMVATGSQIVYKLGSVPGSWQAKDQSTLFPTPTSTTTLVDSPVLHLPCALIPSLSRFGFLSCN